MAVNFRSARITFMAQAATSTLDTVTDYVTDMRILLLDTVAPYRYDDPSVLIALNVTLLEARRLRPDLFVYRDRRATQHFVAVDDTPVHMEEKFRLAVLYGAMGHALSRDQEDVQDARASSFLNLFETVLVGKRRPPIAGGSPGGVTRDVSPNVPKPTGE